MTGRSKSERNFFIRIYYKRVIIEFSDLIMIFVKIKFVFNCEQEIMICFSLEQPATNVLLYEIDRTMINFIQSVHLEKMEN